MTTRGKIILAVLAAGALLAGAAGFVAGRYYIDNKKPNFSEKYVLYVRPEMSVAEVMDSLQAGAGTVRPKSVERAFAKMEMDANMKPGRYVVDSTSTSIYVARMLVYGWQTPQNMTLSGTLRKKDRIAQRISSQMMVDSASVADALNDEAFLAEYGFTPENVFAPLLKRILTAACAFPKSGTASFALTFARRLAYSSPATAFSTAMIRKREASSSTSSPCSTLTEFLSLRVRTTPTRARSSSLAESFRCPSTPQIRQIIRPISETPSRSTR